MKKTKRESQVDRFIILMRRPVPLVDQKMIKKLGGVDLKSGERVFHVNDVHYTYLFERIEGDDALVIDDGGCVCCQCSIHGIRARGNHVRKLKMFPYRELINPENYLREVLTRSTQKVRR